MVKQVPGLKLVLTDPISHPPLPNYQQVDIEETIKLNAGKKGMDKHEEKIRQYVDDYSKGAGKGSSHAAAILEAQGCSRQARASL